MDPLTGTAAIILAITGGCFAILLVVALMKNVSDDKIEVPKSVLTGLGAGAVIFIAMIVVATFAPGFAASAGITTGVTPAAVGPTVTTVIQANKEGYVLAAAEDDYLIPKTALDKLLACEEQLGSV